MPRVYHPRFKKAAERILDAAQELFAEIGFDATKMEHIARSAGVSRQAVYQYGVSKEEIYLLVLNRSARRYRDSLECIDEQQDPRKVLSDVISAMLDEYIGSSRLLLMDVGLHEWIVPPPSVRESAAAYRKVIERALVRGKERGVFRPNASAHIFETHAIMLLAGFGFSRRVVSEFADVNLCSAKALAFWKDYLTESLLMTVELGAPDQAVARRSMLNADLGSTSRAG